MSFWSWGEMERVRAELEQAREEPAAESSTTYTSGQDAGALAARARELGLAQRADRRKSAPSRRDVDLVAERRRPATVETRVRTPCRPMSTWPQQDASPAKWSEPIARALWSAGHRVSDPRQLGERLKRRLPAFRDALTFVDVRPGSRRIALTIDDAPSDLLGSTLDALLHSNMKATFFVIADFCSTYARKQLLERAVREGHELGNHMCDDVSCYGMSIDEFEADLLRCDDLLNKLDKHWRTKKSRCFRPPQGYLNEDMLQVLKRLGYRVALADVFPLDTAVRSVEWLVEFVMAKTRPGSIIILHAPDLRGRHDRRNNVQVFRDLCPKLALEYEVGTLSELVEQRRPTPPSPGLIGDWGVL